jgi:hypothetical protein
MKRFAVLFITALCLVVCQADSLGRAVTITVHPEWKSENSAAPGQPELPFPTLRYAPKDGRNAVILLTLMPRDVSGFVVTDLASLRRFNLLSAQPYLADPENPPSSHELKMRNALAVAMTNEDPALIGKPAPPDEYKIATSVSVLLGGQYLIHCTIFHDEKDSEDLRQALDILQSARVRPEAEAPALTI